MNVDISDNNNTQNLNFVIDSSSNIVDDDFNSFNNNLLHQIFNLPSVPDSIETNDIDISFNNPFNNWINNPLISPLRYGTESRRSSLPPRRSRINFSFPNTISNTRRNRARNIVSAISDLLNIPAPTNDIGGINNLTNRVLQQSLYQEPESFKNILSKKGKDSIQILKYDDTYDDKKCPITCKDFIINQDIAVLPCKHIFTPESIFEWLETEKAECPICRSKLESNEIKKDIMEDNLLEISNNDISFNNFLFPNRNTRIRTINRNINTDIELQQAILLSIQNSNNNNMEESEEIFTDEETTSLLPPLEPTSLYFSIPVSEEIIDEESGWTDEESGWTDDSDINESEDFTLPENESENIINEAENIINEAEDFTLPENESENIINDLDDIFDDLFINIVDEEIV